MIGHRALQATLSTNLGEAMFAFWTNISMLSASFHTGSSNGQQQQTPRVLCRLQLNMGQLRLRQGDWEKAEQALDDATSQYR